MIIANICNITLFGKIREIHMSVASIIHQYLQVFKKCIKTKI